MAITNEAMQRWLGRLMGAAADSPRLSLKGFLEGIGRLESLADVPSGTPVLVRGDTDCKPGEKVGKGDIRLRSMAETLNYGRGKGWIQVIFGHIGRDPKGSLDKVRARLAEILRCDVGFIADWLDPQSATILDAVPAAIRSAAPGSVILLENTRKYEIETLLWKAKPDGIGSLAPKLARLANEFAGKVARVYVHEAFSAGSLDSSSVVVPAAMDRVALGKYEAGEFWGPLMECLEAQLVISSGLKIDKLDDLTAMIDRGKVRWVFTAGSLAMGLKKAAAELDGQTFSMGVPEDPAHKDKPYYIPPARIEQAKKLIAEGRGVRRASALSCRSISCSRTVGCRRRSARRTSNSTSARPPARISRPRSASSWPRPRPIARLWPSTTASSACSRTAALRRARDGSRLSSNG